MLPARADPSAPNRRPHFAEQSQIRVWALVPPKHFGA